MRNKHGLRFNSLCFFRNKTWFVPGDYACLMCSETIDSDGNTFIETLLPGNRLQTPNTCGAINSIGDYIIMAPLWNDDFFVYDYEKKRIKRIRLTDIIDCCEGEGGREHTYFSSTLCLGNEIAFIGEKYPVVVLFDSNGEVSKCIDLRDDIFGLNNMVLGRYPCVEKGKTYIPIMSYPGVIILDNEKKEHEIKTINCQYGCSSICCFGDKAFLASAQSTDIYVLDINATEIVDKIDLPPELLMNGQGLPYCGMLSIGENVWVFPSGSNMILKINKSSGHIECVKQIDGDGVNYLNVGMYSEGKIWGYNSRVNALEIWDCISGESNSYTVWSPSNFEEYWKQEDITAYFGELLFEEEWGLKRFVDGVVYK